jgi:hypothetical protein
MEDERQGEKDQREGDLEINVDMYLGNDLAFDDNQELVLDVDGDSDGEGAEGSEKAAVDTKAGIERLEERLEKQKISQRQRTRRPNKAMNDKEIRTQLDAKTSLEIADEKQFCQKIGSTAMLKNLMDIDVHDFVDESKLAQANDMALVAVTAHLAKNVKNFAMNTALMLYQENEPSCPPGVMEKLNDFRNWTESSKLKQRDHFWRSWFKKATAGESSTSVPSSSSASALCASSVSSESTDSLYDNYRSLLHEHDIKAVIHVNNHLRNDNFIDFMNDELPTCVPNKELPQFFVSPLETQEHLSKLTAFVQKKNAINEEVFLYKTGDPDFKLELHWSYSTGVTFPGDFDVGKGYFYNGTPFHPAQFRCPPEQQAWVGIDPYHSPRNGSIISQEDIQSFVDRVAQESDISVSQIIVFADYSLPEDWQADAESDLAKEQWANRVQDEFFNTGVRHIVKPMLKPKSKKPEGVAVSTLPKHLRNRFASVLAQGKALIENAGKSLRYPENFGGAWNETASTRGNFRLIHEMIKERVVSEFLQICITEVFASIFVGDANANLLWVHGTPPAAASSGEISIFDGETALTNPTSTGRFQHGMSAAMRAPNIMALQSLQITLKHKKPFFIATSDVQVWLRAVIEVTQQNQPKPTITFETSPTAPLTFKVKTVTPECKVLLKPNSQQSIMVNAKFNGYVVIEKIVFEQLVLYQRPKPKPAQKSKKKSLNSKKKKSVAELSRKEVAAKFAKLITGAKFNKLDQTGDERTNISIYFSKE